MKQIRVASVFGSILLTVLTFSALIAASAQANWYVNGKAFSGEETFVSSGSFELELTGPGTRFINCKEAGKGKIFETRKLEVEVTLTGCAIKGAEKSCHVEPISWKVATWIGKNIKGQTVEQIHTWGYSTNQILSKIITKGENCTWYPLMEIGDPDAEEEREPSEEPYPYLCQEKGLNIGYGHEAVALPISTLTCPYWGAYHMFFWGSSTWQLTGPNAGQPWSASPPLATTLDASEVGGSEAKLVGSINPRGAETVYHFEYGPTTSYGTSVPVPDEAIGSGTSTIQVSQAISGLTTGTTYHFRITATSPFGTAYGEDKSFTTREWQIEPTKEQSGTVSAWFDAVSCASEGFCRAVGNYQNTSGHVVAMANYKQPNYLGGKWLLTYVPLPSGATSSYLADVSCPAASKCISVGQSTGSTTSTMAMGEGLLSTPNAPGATSSRLWGVSCTAPSDCTAVGWSTTTGAASTLAERWNGTTWSIMSTPNASGFKKSSLYDVSCVSSSDCWAVGMATNNVESEVSLAEHWNGTTWTVNSPSGSQNLSEISCATASSCVVTTGKNMVVSRWNGSAWSQETVPKPEGAKSARLSGIFCASSSACTAVGMWVLKGSRTQPLAVSWNGSKWTIQSTSEPAGSLEGAELASVSCTSTTSCNAVGSFTLAEAPRTLAESRH